MATTTTAAITQTRRHKKHTHKKRMKNKMFCVYGAGTRDGEGGMEEEGGGWNSGKVGGGGEIGSGIGGGEAGGAGEGGGGGDEGGCGGSVRVSLRAAPDTARSSPPSTSHTCRATQHLTLPEALLNTPAAALVLVSRSRRRRKFRRRRSQ